MKLSLSSIFNRNTALSSLTLLLLSFVVCKPLSSSPLSIKESVEENGKGSFIFDGWAGKPLKVFITVPPKTHQQTSIVIILHGRNRNAEGYRNSWHSYALDNNFIAVVPEFKSSTFPKDTFNWGNIRSLKGRTVERQFWLLSVIEPLFDEVRGQLKIQNDFYSLYGHSAGAQIAHRFLYFIPDNRAKRIVMANAGYYTMPVDTVNFPQGIKDVDVSDTNLVKAYSKRVIVLLGDDDIDPEHSSLNKDLQSMRQGRHRFSRGHRFYMNSLFKASILLKVPFNWSLSIAPGVGHSNRSMVKYAYPLLLRGPLEVY